MKLIPFILFIIISSFNLFAQKEIVFVDYDKVIKEHPMKSYYDSIYRLEENSVILKLGELNEELNNLYDFFVDCVDYPKEAIDSVNMVGERKIKELNELQFQIQDFQVNAKIKLKELKTKHDSIIRNEILEVIKNISKEKKYFYVIDKKELGYFKNSVDVTKVVLSKIIDGKDMQ